MSQGLLRSLFDSNRNSHTNHGVVTCADESHHLYASGASAIASIGMPSCAKTTVKPMIKIKRIKPVQIIKAKE